MTGDLPQTVEAWLGREREGLAFLARGLVRCQADAEDCVQDASLAALLSPPTSNAGAWLRTVVRRRASRQGRDASRRWRREVQAARPEGVDSAQQAAEHLELRERVLAAVKALDEPYRTTVTLRYFEGHTPSRIASLQGIPVKTVKTRLSRGLAQLRSDLDRAYGGKRSAWAPLVVAIGGMGRLGRLLLLTKVAALAVVLLLGGALAWWALRDGSTEQSALSGVEMATVAKAPTLQGSSALRDPSPVASGAVVLREGDPVPITSFAGRVVDPAGRGVAGARVGVVWADPGSTSNVFLIWRREAERREHPASVTDPEGYFRKDRPYGSTSYLRVDADGFVPRISGPHSSGTFVLVRLATSGAARVRVLSRTGRPVEGAEVRMGTPASSCFQVLASVRTDAAGSADLPSSMGELRVQVVPMEPGLGTVERPFASSEEEVEIRLPPVRVVERRLVDAGTGLPARGAWMDVLPVQPGSLDLEPQRRRVLADRDGVVRFPMQPGYAEISAGAPGYEASRHLLDGTTLPTIPLVRAMKVEGVVTDEDGAPVADAAIVVVIPDGAGMGSRSFEEARCGRSPIAAWSDEAGRFALEITLPYARFLLESETLPPDRGVRTLLALHPAHAAAVVDGVPVTPGDRAHVTLRFPRPGSLAIEVVENDGKAAIGQWVTVWRMIPRAATWSAPARPGGVNTVALVQGPGLTRVAAGRALTDESGRALVDGLPPGPHCVRTENTRVVVEVREGETTSVRVVKGGGPSIRGRVIDPDGAPQADAAVSLTGPEPGFFRTGSDGHFAFADLPDGEYRISVRLGDGKTARSAPVKPGDEVTMTVPPGPARLRIHVDGPPRGTAGYSLYTEAGVMDPPSRGFAPLTTDPFETAPFVPGVGILVVQAPGFGWTAVRFEAIADRTTDVAVSLPRSGDVVVRVREAVLATEAASGEGLLRLTRTDGLLKQAVGTDDLTTWMEYGPTQRLLHGIHRSHGNVNDIAGGLVDGAFRFADISPGPYEASYGHYDKDGPWISRGSTRIEVRSGETTTVDL